MSRKPYFYRTLISKLFVLFKNSQNQLNSLNYLNSFHIQWIVEDSEDKNAIYYQEQEGTG